MVLVGGVMINSPVKDDYKLSRIMYILEAAFEYFIAVLVGGAYLAKVTSSIGIPDSVTGILTSFVSLGCTFQIVAIFLINKRPVKRWVTFLHTINQLFFALIYLTPFLKISQEVKVALFIVFLLGGHVINNVVNAPKINWFMSLVDDDKRGSFTANKEIVSLIGGMLFSLFIGFIIDKFEAEGNLQGAFVFCGIGVFVLAMLHTATLIISREKPIETQKQPTTKILKELIKDKKLILVAIIPTLWNIAHYVATPFYGTYQINELGFSMSFVSILAVVYAVVRSVFSKPLGKFADKRSFTTMTTVCYIIASIGFLINTFTVPSNGKVFYTVYYVLYAIAMAGINSGAINLIYDFVDKEKRTGALALSQSIAGISGFLTTLLASVLVDHIQKTNTLFGIPVYAQQVVSLIACILTALIPIYVLLVIKKLK
ncbi:MAG: MFS transporter [Clostridia bacterium]|nr:MFS transporter [Clostridia bacterium]